MVNIGRDQWQYEHRIVAALMLGRRLRRTEIVHHKDDNGLNNEPENLEVCEWGAHTRHHCRITTWTKKYPACRKCGAIHRRHAAKGFCSMCYQRLPGKSWRDRYAKC
jgi:hypothetical protein